MPAIGEDKVDVYAKKSADLGIVPVKATEFNDAPPGTLFATDPPGGTKVANGAKVKLLVSSGQPQVIFTNEKDILRVNGATTKKLDPIASGPQDETNPTWSADGTHVAYVAGGRILLKDITKKNAAAVPLTPAGDDDSNLAWAPTADVNVLAFSRFNGQRRRSLPRKDHARRDWTPSCISDPAFSITRVIHWAPNGRTILAFAGKNDGSGTFGIVRWRIKKDKPAFSANAADWTKGRFVSDISTPHKGMIDAALSPDGKRLAMVSNQGSSIFRLWIGDDPTDFLLSSAKQTSAARVQGRLARRRQGAAGGPGRCRLHRGCRHGRARAHEQPAHPEGAERRRGRPRVPAVHPRRLMGHVVPQLPSPARAWSELLRQLWGAAQRRERAAGAGAR